MSAERRERLVAITLDYETWQPVPPGRSISWTDDVLDPTRRLLDVCDETGARLTIMAEVGEYFWLRDNDPEVAKAMEEQWRSALGRGHDVQLHLHLSWLPELGARYEGGQYVWPQDYLRADDYEGDLTALVARCTHALEQVLRPVRSDYAVTCFRAGAYQVQPFKRLHDALVANGIECDSSVHAGGVSRERGYDFRLARSEHQPYFASPHDPQLEAPPAEARILELPVFTPVRGQRWFFDGSEGPLVARRLLESRFAEPRAARGVATSRGLPALARLLWGGPRASLRGSRTLNRALPRRVAHALAGGESPAPLTRDYFVMIGHSKGDLRFEELKQSLLRLRNDAGARFATLSEMAVLARRDLAGRPSLEPSRGAASLWSAGAAPLTRALWQRAPGDRDRVLDVPRAQGAAGAAAALGWAQVTELEPASPGAGPERAPGGSLATLPFEDASFDLAGIDQALAREPAVDAALRELWRVLRPGGALVAAIPSDARNPALTHPGHAWRTAPHEIALRLEAAGFVNLELEEPDGYRQLGLPPYPPGDDRVSLVRAFKRERPKGRLDRAREVMDWVYRRLDPERPHEGNDVASILRGGYAWCAGYNEALARLLQREGFAVTWVTLEAEGHPRGRGPRSTDSHEVLEVAIDGRPHVFDPMANTCHAHSLAELLSRPELAGPRTAPDERYRARGYELYDTSLFYSKVVRYCLRADPIRDPCVFRPVVR